MLTFRFDCALTGFSISVLNQGFWPYHMEYVYNNKYTYIYIKTPLVALLFYRNARPKWSRRIKSKPIRFKGFEAPLPLVPPHLFPARPG